MSKKVAYFAYGCNMSTQWLKNRVVYAKPLSRAKLPNKRLVCNKKSIDGSGKANLVDSPRDMVWGVLYEIDEVELNKLDLIEGGYKREILEVITDEGSPVKAHVYISSKLTKAARPYDRYKELMIKGAREHQLPASYMKYLEQINSKPSPGRGEQNF